MLKNPEDYPDPDNFIPERFLDQDGNINPDVRDPSTIAFGFGRRCVPREQLHLIPAHPTALPVFVQGNSLPSTS